MNMSKHKTWSRTFLAILLVFLAANFVIWEGFTKEMMNAGEYWTPDLVRLGYVTGSTLRRKSECTLPRRHIESAAYTGQRIDVLTVGDSFSNMQALGKDTLYQDWLATVRDRTVLNVRRFRGLDEAGTLIALMNGGYLDRVRPRTVILEIAERHCIKKLARQIDFDLTLPESELQAQLARPEERETLPTLGFINTSNFKFLANGVLYRLSANAFFSQVYIKDLSKSFFSVPRDKRLLFFFEELTSIGRANAESVQALNRNLNTLALRLRRKGITLLFMPAPSKYTIYSDYIVDNPYPPSVFFELLRPLPKEYVFVDTKALLMEEIRKGEKDVYFADETHWSCKAAKKIAESMKL